MKKISIQWIKDTSGYYQIFATSKAAVTALLRHAINLKYNPDKKHYTARVAALPSSKNLNLKEIVLEQVRANPVNEAVKRKSLKLFQEILEKEAEIEKMVAKTDQEIQRLENLVRDHGLKLKQGYPNDSQIYLKELKTRLHFQEAVCEAYSIDAIEELKAKYPILGKALFLETRMRLNSKVLVEEVLPNLPSKAINAILSLEVTPRFVRTSNKKKSACEHCGGDLNRLKECKNCKI
jgi:hypothetical protein